MKNKKQFHVQCHMKTYQMGNISLRERHSTMLREETFTFPPIDELVMSMPFEFISKLKVGTWTRVDPNWLTRLHKFLTQADNHAIKQIRFVRRIYRTTLYAESQEDENENDRFLYEVFPSKGDKYYVNYTQIHDIVGGEEWLNGEIKTLSNIGSNRIVSLTWGCKKKESLKSNMCLNSEDTLLCVGDRVIVLNHGDKWIHLARIVEINNVTSSAVVKWDTSLRKDTVDLADCQKYDNETILNRKHKATDFYQNLQVKKSKIRTSKKSEESLEPPPGQMKNMFYSTDNLTKLCAEGAIRNLMNMLQCSAEDTSTFWELATSPLLSIKCHLKEDSIPKAVLKYGKWIDSIQKCLWILRKKFNFATTTNIKLNLFHSLELTLQALFAIKFPMLISVESSQATYNHVVVVWRNMIIDFECMHTYALTEESLRQVCGVHTTFVRLTSGYGIIPPNPIRSAMKNADDYDWGMDDYYKPLGSVRKYFTSK